MKEVTVNYQTVRDTCTCCHQKLQQEEKNERKFSFSKEDFLNWGSWEHWKFCQEDEDILRESIEEFVCETIRFFALNMDTRLSVGNSELEKVEKFFKEEVAA
ncbi:hypothetical protein SAMN05192559_10479 [Halobacillus karajensis]|uniref:hypothetical protein n=1 Tax=Halobacillus karajensis TaxID=195088 RepID=UPI0008A732CE|nr:hypothetical protein [Halobacillus karajensis]SEH78070.1 hypothetical protein SAMN05192559_10479 [Halobacillus karajensis]